MSETSEVEKKLVDIREKIVRWEAVIKFNKINRARSDGILHPLRLVETDLVEQLYLLDCIRLYDDNVLTKARDAANAEKVAEVDETLTKIEFRITELENALKGLGLDPDVAVDTDD